VEADSENDLTECLGGSASDWTGGWDGNSGSGGGIGANMKFVFGNKMLHWREVLLWRISYAQGLSRLTVRLSDLLECYMFCGG